MADQKITALTAATTLAMTDLVPVVTGVITTPVTEKMPFANFIKSMGGTSFPASPAAGWMFFRSDLGLDCYYDGTRWLTKNEYSIPFPMQAALSSDGNVFWFKTRADFGLYFTRYTFSTQVHTTNDGSKYWTVNIRSYANDWTATTTIHTFTTAADTVNAWATHAGIPSTPVAVHYGGYIANVAKTSTPGNIDVIGTVFYRLIVT